MSAYNSDYGIIDQYHKDYWIVEKHIIQNQNINALLGASFVKIESDLYGFYDLIMSAYYGVNPLRVRLNNKVGGGYFEVWYRGDPCLLRGDSMGLLLASFYDPRHARAFVDTLKDKKYNWL